MFVDLGLIHVEVATDVHLEDPADDPVVHQVHTLQEGHRVHLEDPANNCSCTLHTRRLCTYILILEDPAYNSDAHHVQWDIYFIPYIFNLNYIHFCFIWTELLTWSEEERYSALMRSKKILIMVS